MTRESRTTPRQFGIHGDGERRRLRLANAVLARRANSLADLVKPADPPASP